MKVRVLFFGRLKDITGCAEEETDVAEGARVEDVFSAYARRFAELGRYRGSVVASVNQEFAAWSAGVRAGDEVAFLPPVSGGQQVAAAEDVVELVHTPIAMAQWAQQVKAPRDGAVVVFDGIVRDHSGDRRTLYLEYEAYAPMALAKMREIVAAMRAQFAIDRVVMVHRLGRLEIGETSVLIAVSAPHRAAAFDACRLAIETLKRSVPIWKKEYFADGAVWVEGHRPGPVDSAQSFSPADESIS